jgi:hypothetical protein
MKKPHRRGSIHRKKKKRRGNKRDDQRGEEFEREIKIQKFPLSWEH